MRFGVAPDHPEVKTVQNDFAQVAASKRVTYFGNVQVGEDVSVDFLRARYDAVVLAYGAKVRRRSSAPSDARRATTAPRRSSSARRRTAASASRART